MAPWEAIVRRAWTVLVIACSLVPAAAGLAPPGGDVRDANVAFFLALVGDDVDPETSVTLAATHAERTITLAEAARLFAARAGPVDVGSLVQQAALGDETPDPVAGEVWLLETYLGPSGNPTGACSRGGAGEGGHYADAWAMPVPPKYYPYTGRATSFVSEHGLGIATWWDAPLEPQVIGYREVVRYAGSSDFWCLSFEHTFTFVLNFPFLYGAAVWGPLPRTCLNVFCPV